MTHSSNDTPNPIDGIYFLAIAVELAAVGAGILAAAAVTRVRRLWGPR